MVMYVTLELPVMPYMKSKMCKSIYFDQLHLRPVLRLNLVIKHLLKLLETLFCVVASVLEGLDWQLVFDFGFFFCQLCDNINSQVP